MIRSRVRARGGIIQWFLSSAYKADSVSPSLILDFANNRYAANSSAKNFSDILTFSRSTTATYFDANGVMQTAAADVPRFDCDPATGVANGLLVEGARTNLNPYSDTIKSGWTTSISGTGVSPVLDVIDSDSLVNLPDSAYGSDVGKGFTCTGLCYDSVDGCFWVGNFGKATPASPPATPALVKLSLDGTTILTEFPVSGAPQGVTYDTIRDKLYYAVGGASIRSINKDGTGDVVIKGSFSNANGVAYDSLRDNLWLTDGADFVRIDLSGVEQQRFTYSLSSVDQLFYDAEHDWLWVSYNASGSAGFVAVLKCSDGSVIKNWYRFADAYAIEGIVIKDGCIYVTNDGYYHQADIADPARHVNQLQKYPIDFGIIDGNLPAYLKLNIGSGSTSADNSFLIQSIVSSANRTFSGYFKAAHNDSPIFTLRVDDSSGAWYQGVYLNNTWTRSFLNKTTGTTTQTVKILLRGDQVHTDICRMWVQGLQVEDGTSPSSYIPTSGSAVTRSADIVSNSASNTVKFSDWYNQSEGGFFVGFTPMGVPPASQFSTVVSATDGTEGERISILHRHTLGIVRTDIVDGGVAQASVGTSTVTTQTYTQFAFSYKLNDCASSLNGGAVATATSVTIPTPNSINFNGAAGTSDNFLWVKELRYYPIRVTNSEMVRLTT